MNARIKRGVHSLQIVGNRWCRSSARLALAAAMLTWSVTGFGQQAEQVVEPVPEDYYRAEFVILERIIEPESVNEEMAGRAVEPIAETDEILWSVTKDGTSETTLKLVPQAELHLAPAAGRLERSGRYRVLLSAGWYEAFPPDYEGAPLRVAVGDWLEGAGMREIEGTITIDRQRYLHVAVELNHWQLADTTAAPGEGGFPASQTPGPESAVTPEAGAKTLPREEASAGKQTAAGTAMEPVSAAASAPVELLTWIHETRRMRSEEIHFLDSPTIGVLVFFKKIEASD